MFVKSSKKIEQKKVKNDISPINVKVQIFIYFDMGLKNV